jgi:hypothetical protein
MLAHEEELSNGTYGDSFDLRTFCFCGI